MVKTNWKRAALALGFCFTTVAMTCAQTAPTAVPTASELVLHVQTADGKALQAPVVKFKALSLAVMATLIKEKKMKPSQTSGSNPSGTMTFYLDKTVPADFVNWAKNSLGQTGGNVAKTSGQFVWPSKGGYPAETFEMQGLKVVGFTPADDSNGIQLMLAADKTEAFPPLKFKTKK